MKKMVAMFCMLALLLCVAFTALAADDQVYISGDYEYKLQEDSTAEITKYIGATAELTVPAELDGHPVTRIGNNAFRDCSGLTSIQLPEGLTSISNNAFRDCTGLTDIQLPEGLISIGNNAFRNCDGLTITVTRNSYAAQYCQEKGFRYTYPDALDWLLN